jgi:hypothetical protein
MSGKILASGNYGSLLLCILGDQTEGYLMLLYLLHSLFNVKRDERMIGYGKLESSYDLFEETILATV